jgi:hypothetical protein
MSDFALKLPPGFTCSTSDRERALDALEHVFQDEPLPNGEATFRQSALVDLLRGRGIERALGAMVIEELLDQKVFRAGSSFFNIRTMVRFDEQQTDEVTPERYLYTTRQKWFGYLTTRRSRYTPGGRAQEPSIVQSSVGKDANGHQAGGSRPDAKECIWQRDEKKWTLAFGGTAIEIQHRVGLQRIAKLIAMSPHEIHVCELVAPGTGHPIVKPFAGTEILDAEARERYRKRYEDLCDRLAEARRNNDLASQEKLQIEIQALESQLKGEKGLGRRKRKLGDEIEKLRKAVQMSISRAIKSIATKHPELARHLENSIHLGIYLRYQPETHFDWKL